jgi:hypothetical protein
MTRIEQMTRAFVRANSYDHRTVKRWLNIVVSMHRKARANTERQQSGELYAKTAIVSYRMVSVAARNLRRIGR